MKATWDGSGWDGLARLCSKQLFRIHLIAKGHDRPIRSDRQRMLLRSSRCCALSQSDNSMHGVQYQGGKQNPGVDLRRHRGLSRNYAERLGLNCDDGTPAMRRLPNQQATARPAPGPVSASTAPILMGSLDCAAAPSGASSSVARSVRPMRNATSRRAQACISSPSDKRGPWTMRA